MTPAGMRRVLDGLISGSLLSGRQRQPDDNCLGWDCSGAGQAGYRGKVGGGGDPGSAGLQIFFGILAGTIPVVIATNSNPPRCRQSFKPPCMPPPAPGSRQVAGTLTIPPGQMTCGGAGVPVFQAGPATRKSEGADVSMPGASLSQVSAAGTVPLCPSFPYRPGSYLSSLIACGIIS